MGDHGRCPRPRSVVLSPTPPHPGRGSSPARSRFGGTLGCHRETRTTSFLPPECGVTQRDARKVKALCRRRWPFGLMAKRCSSYRTVCLSSEVDAHVALPRRTAREARAAPPQEETRLQPRRALGARAGVVAPAAAKRTPCWSAEGPLTHRFTETPAPGLPGRCCFSSCRNGGSDSMGTPPSQRRVAGGHRESEGLHFRRTLCTLSGDQLANARKGT